MAGRRKPVRRVEARIAAHLEKYEEEGYRQAESVREGDEREENERQAERTAFRQLRRSHMGQLRELKAQREQLQAGCHRSIVKKRHFEEGQQVRLEQTMVMRRRLKQQRAKRGSAAEVEEGIDEFEMNLRRVAEDAPEGSAAAYPPKGESPYQHLLRLRNLLPSKQELDEATAEHMARVKNLRQKHVAARKERESRRRQLTAEQAATARLKQQKAAHEQHLHQLAEATASELALSGQAWRRNQQEQALEKARRSREVMYAERREAEWTAALQRDSEELRSTREERHSAALLEREARIQQEEQRQIARRQKHERLCREAAWGLVQLAERVYEHREEAQSMVPRKAYREWINMFIRGDPRLGTPIGKPEKPQAQIDVPLDDLSLTEYINFRGAWRLPDVEREAGENLTKQLGEVLAEVAGAAQRARVPDSEQREFAQKLAGVPLRMCILGAPMSGKTSAAQELAQQLNVKVITADSVVADAVKAAEDWDAEQFAVSTAETGEVPEEHAAPQEDQPEAMEAGGMGPVPEKVLLGQKLREAEQSGTARPRQAVMQLAVLQLKDVVDQVLQEQAEAAEGGGEAAELEGSKQKGKAVKGKMEEAAAPQPLQGFVIDGLVCDAESAVLLEKLLTGLDLETEQLIKQQSSRVAPAPPSAFPSRHRLLHSGLDVVVALQMGSSKALVERREGCRRDPVTGRMFHLQYHPPPQGDQDLQGRLEEAAVPTEEAAAMQLEEFSASWQGIASWYARFDGLLAVVDGAAERTAVQSGVLDIARRVLDGKAAASALLKSREALQRTAEAAELAQQAAWQAKARAQGLARQLLQAKMAEVMRRESGSAPAAGDAPVAAALDSLAEQLKLCNAAALEAAQSSATATLQVDAATSAAHSAKAGACGTAACSKAEATVAACQGAAEQARDAALAAAAKAVATGDAAQDALSTLAEAVGAATDGADADAADTKPAAESHAEEEATAEAAAAEPAAAAPVQVEGPLMMTLDEQWRAAEANYIAGATQVLANLRAELAVTEQHFTALRRQFLHHLHRPLPLQEAVDSFTSQLQEPAAAPPAGRTLANEGAALEARLARLRDDLWDSCDERQECNLAALEQLQASDVSTGLAAELEYHLVSMLQVELQRSLVTQVFIEAYACASQALPAEPQVAALAGVLEAASMRMLGGLDRVATGPETVAEFEQWLRQGSLGSAAVSLLQASTSRLRWAATKAFAASLVPLGRARELQAAAEAEREAERCGRAVAAVEACEAGPRAGHDEQLQAEMEVGAGEDVEGGEQQDERQEAEQGGKVEERSNVIVEAGTGAEGEGGGDKGEELVEAEAAGDGGEDGGREAGDPASNVPQADATEQGPAQQLAAMLLEEEGLLMQGRVRQALARALRMKEEVAAVLQDAMELAQQDLVQQYKADCATVSRLVADIRTEASSRPGNACPQAALQRAAAEAAAAAAPRPAPAVACMLTAPPEPQVEPDVGRLSLQQLQQLVQTFKSADGVRVDSIYCRWYLPIQQAAVLLSDNLPACWPGRSVDAVERALAAAFDAGGSRHLDWRQLVVALLLRSVPKLRAAPAAAMAEAAQRLAEADGDGDGRLRRSEWAECELALLPEASGDTSDRATSADAVKELLWQVFAGAPGSSCQWSQVEGVNAEAERAEGPAAEEAEGPAAEQAEGPAAEQAEEAQAAADSAGACDASSELAEAAVLDAQPEAGQSGSAAEEPTLDINATLLYLCADPHLALGVRKALAVLRRDASATAQAQVVYCLAYPHGPQEGLAIGRSPLSRQNVVDVVQDAQGSLSKPQDPVEISLDQLLYSGPCQLLAGSLLGRYHLQDLHARLCL